jgi:hypothetical protein
MRLWSKIQVGLVVIAGLCALAGDNFSIPILLYIGTSLFGMAVIAIGLEAMVTNSIVLYRRRSYSETFQVIAAYAQGVQFCLIGVFFIGASLAAYLNEGNEIFLYLVRRPWSVLTVVGVYCLMQAVIIMGGPVEQEKGANWLGAMEFIAGRLLPGGILILIGLAALGLGLFEFIAPAQFDALGGGFLEVLFGA